jgi:hypothetical protein
MSDNNNVVLFPPDRIINPSRTPLGNNKKPKNLEDIKTNLNLVHHVYINDILENMVPLIVNQLEAAGFDITCEENVKDGAFLVEAFRSMLCKQYNIDHPFQKLADNIFVTEEDGNLRVVKKISIDLNK